MGAQVVTRHCAAYRAPGAEDVARVEARRALAVLTEREVASFALTLLLEIESPVMCGAVAAVGSLVTDHGAELLRRATARVEERR
jgi:hypothetical protein